MVSDYNSNSGNKYIFFSLQAIVGYSGRWGKSMYHIVALNEEANNYILKQIELNLFLLLIY